MSWIKWFFSLSINITTFFLFLLHRWPIFRYCSFDINKRDFWDSLSVMLKCTQLCCCLLNFSSSSHRFWVLSTLLFLFLLWFVFLFLTSWDGNSYSWVKELLFSIVQSFYYKLCYKLCFSCILQIWLCWAMVGPFLKWYYMNMRTLVCVWELMLCFVLCLFVCF